MLRYSLVGWDGSDCAKRAFAFALDFARASGGRVRVVNVIQLTEGAADVSVPLMVESSRQRREALMHELLDEAPDSRELVDVDLVYGSPGNALLGQVADHGVDHIVIGHTERGALGRFLLGSVSDDILDRSHVPVTVVR